MDPGQLGVEQRWGLSRVQISGIVRSTAAGLKLKNVATTTGALTAPIGATRVAK